jgi:glycosyltransferase involved in cell wall biosynthesis
MIAFFKKVYMESVLFIIGLVTCLYLIFTVFEFIFGFNKIKNLTDQPLLDKNQLPPLSIVLSALNEEENIEKALLTLIELDYPDLEIIAINDRSTDETPLILNRLQAQHPRLKVYHISELPKDWFGKNHALHLGSQVAQGEWLLFTDADVIMRNDTLIKSISYVLENQLDHLTIYENHQRNYFWLKILLLGLYVAYSMDAKPWRISYSWSKKSLGHGAFNLVNKKAYEACGGHAAIAMECLDDLKLGSLLKDHGFRQDTVDGRDFIGREWYSSLVDMIHGMKKNSFAYYNYQIFPACRDAFLALAFFVGPFIAAILFEGPIRSVNLVNIALTLFISVYVAKQFRLQKRYAVFYPIAVGILIYTVFNSVFSVCRNKGVIWRGTFYSLSAIKNQQYRLRRKP